MEDLIHYCWKHKLFPLAELKTIEGQPIEVIDTGLHNRDAGPDFFNAKVKIGKRGNTRQGFRLVSARTRERCSL